MKSLRLNRTVPVETLAKIISQCPNLEDLGTGALNADHFSEAYLSLTGALQKCKKLRRLSGFWDVSPLCLLAVYPVCANLTGLNLSYAPTVQGQDFVNLIQHCVKLQRLWVLFFAFDMILFSLVFFKNYWYELIVMCGLFKLLFLFVGAMVILFHD